MPRYTTVTIADDGATIKVLGTFNGASKEIYFNKHDSRVSGNPDLNEIYFHDASGSAIVTAAFADVVSPVEANYTDLIAFVQGLYDTGGSLPAGAATEAKQDLMIADLNLMDGTTSATSSVASNVASVTLKASNTSRVKLVIVNEGDDNLYVKEGATASVTDYTYKLEANDTLIIDDYTGIVDGIWDVASGSARITETV
jgi:hypothetical protein